MTIIQPTRIISAGYDFTWNAAASDQTDKNAYSIRLNAATAPPHGHLVACRVSGTGIYNFDWKVDGGTLIDTDIVVFPWNASGVTQYQVPILVNENLDATETHVLTIVRDVGVTPAHTATCALGATKPSATNTGHAGGANQAWGGSYTLNSPVQADGQIFTNTLSLNSGASNSRFTNCWFKGGTFHGVAFYGAGNCVFDHCEFGQNPHDADKLKNTSIYNSENPASIGNKWFWCLFHGAQDHTKLAVDGDLYFESCYFTRFGLLKNGVDNPHGDNLQTTPDKTVLLGVTYYNCFIDWRKADADAIGASSNAAFQGNPTAIHRNYRWISCWVRCGGYTFRFMGDSQGGMVANCQLGDKAADRGVALLDPGGNNGQVVRRGNKEYTDGTPLTSFNKDSAFP